MTEAWEDDRDLLDALREAADAADPVPEVVSEAARASLTWLRVDAELAELVQDSAGAELAGVRSEQASRLVSFSAGSVSIDMEIIAAGENRRLIGHMTPPGPAQLEIRHARSRSATTVPVDDLGRFTADGVEPGTISLVTTPPSATTPVATTWLHI
jgi:hypothetical protein